MAHAVSGRVFSTQDTCHEILSFLSLDELLQSKAICSSLKKETESYLVFRRLFHCQVLRNPRLSSRIYAFLTTKDLDRSKAVESAYKKSISKYQEVQVRRLFSKELGDVVQRAIFHNFNLPEEPLSDTLTIGYAKGVPYLSCKVNIFWMDRTVTDALFVEIDRKRGCFLYGERADFLNHSIQKFSALVKDGKIAPEWAVEDCGAWAGRIYDAFKKICCCGGAFRPKQLWPEMRLYDAKSASDKKA